jgi:hypothetical protein
VLGVEFEVLFDVAENTKVMKRMEVTVPPQCEAEFAELRRWTETTRSPLVFFQALVQVNHLVA